MKCSQWAKAMKTHYGKDKADCPQDRSPEDPSEAADRAEDSQEDGAPTAWSKEAASVQTGHNRPA
jgi:hypothetical protein